MNSPDAQPAGTLRVLEYAGPGAGITAAYAGWMLGRLGADVSTIGSGDTTRSSDEQNALKLECLALGENKKALAEAAEPSVLARHLAGSDIFISDVPPSRLPAAVASLFGDRDTLGQRFPMLIAAFATVHGLDGPDSDLPATVLDAQAVSATAWALGDAAREPLTLPVGVAEHQSGAMLAAGCLLALSERDRSGKGQVVDISLTEVLASHVAANSRVYVHHGLKWHRNGRRPYGSCGAYPFAILPCKDGEICISGRTREEWQRLINAMGNPSWASEPRYQDLRAMGTRYPEEGDALLAPWLMQHTRAELEALALQHNLILSPLRSFAEVLNSPQFADRQFLDSANLGGRAISWPGLPFRMMSERSESAEDRAASMLKAVARETDPKASASAGRYGALPLSGLRVLDFGWVWSAPWVGTMLSEMGAEVIKVEHSQRPDNTRLAGKVIRDGKVVEGPTREMSPMFHQINHGKLGITLNLKDARAIDLAHRLVAQSDLVIENMSPGSMERAGLGFEALRLHNPKLVMLSMSAAGQFGPAASMRAYAPTMSAFAGLESLVGYEGESPIGALNFAIGDPNASLHGLVAALAALRHVRSGGQGVYIDLSQVESLASILRAHLLDAQVRGFQPEPMGNRHPDFAPHGIYPTVETDCWLSIAVASDAQWSALARISGERSIAADTRFADQAGRRRHARELDQAISGWTSREARASLLGRLRTAGIAASPVNTLEGIWSDPQLLFRGATAEIDIPYFGADRIFTAPWRLSGVSPKIDRPGPRLGQHNRSVFGRVLNLSDDEITTLTAEGVLS